MPRSSYDEQVVKMVFDNSNFDQNINDSINALNNLDLQLGSLNRTDFSSITNNLDRLAKTFTVKGQIMLGVFTSLGKKIVGVADDLKHKLFAGMRDGLGEYKLIIDSTQTIYQNVKQSGASLENVNDALDELNDYADKTIYNFAEMTRMIGMFTSAGVSLKKSVSTIKGLANAAALVGANSEKAQVAWHAVSRAMSSGTFSNITWKSLELSNIAGEQFNKVITEVARANKVVGKSGKNIDEMIKKYGSLRLTLSEGWLNKDIFAEAMQILSGDLNDVQLKQKGYTQKQIDELLQIAASAEAAATQVKTFQQLLDTTKEAIGSGWAQSFRILIGDLEQSKKLFTRISIVLNDFIDNNAKIRNKLFTEIVDDRGLDGIWKTGRENFQQTIENMLAIVKTFLKAVKTGFLNIFPIERISAAARKVLDVMQKATRALVLNKEQLDDAGNVLGWDTENITKVTDAIKDLIRFFRGLASAVDIAWMAIYQPLTVIVRRIPFLNNFFSNTNSSVLNLVKNLGKFGDKITVIRNAIKNTNLFGEFLTLILDNLDEIGQEYPVLGSILSVFKNIKTAVEKLKDGLDKLKIKPLNVLLGALKLLLSGIWTLLSMIFKAIETAKSKVDWSFLEEPKNAIGKFIKILNDYGQGLISFKDITGKIGDAISKTFDKITAALEKFKFHKTYKVVSVELEDAHANIDHTLKSTGGNISKIWTKITSFFDPIKQFFANIFNGADLTLEGIIKKILLIGGAVGAATLGITVLIKTLKKVSIIDNINALLTGGLNILKAYQREMQSKMVLNIAIAIGILAGAMVALAFVPYEKLENGLVIFATFMAVLATTLTPIITAMAKFNTSLQYTRKQVKELTKMDVLNNLVVQLGNFGRQMATGFNKKMIGEMFKDVAMAIFIFVGAIAALVLMFRLDGENTIKAMNAIAGMVAVLAGALAILILEVELLSRVGKSLQTSVDAFSSFFKLSGVARVILAIAAAVLVLVGALAIMTKLDPNRLQECWAYLMFIIAALGVIAITITGIASLADNMGKFKKVNISLGGAILGIAAVLLVMKTVIKTIEESSSNSWIAAIVMFTAIITQFTGMSIALLAVGKAIGAEAMIWGKMEKYLLTMAVVFVAMAGAVAVLSMIPPINKSVLVTFSILSVALGMMVSLLTAIGVLTTITGGSFAKPFVMVIAGIAGSIAAIVTSFGILAAGVAALIAAINAVDISGLDDNDLSKSLIKKLEKLSDAISGALPKLKKMFYNIGRSVGTMFTYFLSGFADAILDVGETYNKIAYNLVNLVLDILGKVIAILYSRKNEIARIVRQAIELLGGIITAVVASFFQKADGSPIFSQKQIMGALGVVGIAAGIIKVLTVFTKLANAFNTVTKAANLSTIAGGFFKASLVEIIAAIGAVAAAVAIVKAAYHDVMVSIGKDTRKINTDIQTVEDALSHIGTDTTFTFETFSMGIEQFGLKIVSGWMNVFYTIASGVMWLMDLLLGPIAAQITLLVAEAAALGKLIDPANKDKYNDMIQKASKIESYFRDTAKDFWQKGMDDFKFAWSFDTWIDPNEKIEVYKDTKEMGEYATQGAIDGWDGEKVNKEMMDSVEGIIGDMTGPNGFDEHSPSKVTREIYHNLMLGALDGLNLGKDELERRTQEIVDREKEIFENGAVNVAAAWADIEKANGWNSNVRDMNVKFVDTRHGTNTAKEVQLNTEMVDLIREQAKALNGKNREQARNIILQEMQARGMATDAEAIEQMQLTLEAFYSKSNDGITITAQNIEEFAKGTIKSVMDVAGKSAAANELVIQDTYGRYFDLMSIAEQQKDLLVGKKKEEVEEILKQEALKAGLTQQEATDTAKLVAGQMFAGMKAEESITKQGLENQLKANETEYMNYEKMQYAKTKLLQEEYDIRHKLAEKQAWIQSKFDAGWTTSEYQSWMKSSEGQAYTRLLNQHNSKVNEYKNIVKQQQDSIKKLYTDAGMSTENAAKKYASDFDRALGLINTSVGKQSGTIKDKISNVISSFGKMLGLNAGDVNLDYWNLPTDKNSTELSDTDAKSAIDSAADLKKGLEAQRADLTPVFDLDKLESDANKANGIVMSSLMAAQNASIGDYINKDSELNPFMKDRWQNVYNFTQNNYSPKALSRIDIYRQTQRQLSMSRGF